MNVALFCVVDKSALENVFYFNLKVLSRLPNRNKARKLLKFAVFDIFQVTSQIVCCSYVRYIYILNQSTNYTFIDSVKR